MTSIARKQKRIIKRKLKASGNMIKPSYFNGKYFRQTGKLQPFSDTDYLTPIPLVNEMWDIFAKHFKNNIYNIKVLDPSCGRGPFLVKAYEILFNDIYCDIEDIDFRNKLCIDSLYGFDIDIRYVNVTILQLEEIQKYYGATKILKPNIYNKDFLNTDINMKFDIVIGNPPYNWSSDTGEDQRRNNRENLWSRFVIYSWKNLIKDGGFIMMVTPNTWLSPSTDYSKFRIYDLMFSNDDANPIHVNIDECGKHFKVGSTFSYYLVQNSKNQNNCHTITTNGQVNIDYSKYDFIPNNFDSILDSIIKKTFDLKYDKFIFNQVGVPTRGETFEQSPTKTHPNLTYHTNSKKGLKVYSRHISNEANTKKILVNLSGMYNPVFDYTGTISQSVMNMVMDCSSSSLIDLENYKVILNSKLFYLLMNDSFRYNGWVNAKILLKLPNIKFNKKITELEFYKQGLSLTQEEINYIENAVN